MDNPAVHNLDDVRLRAENGQLVLEVAGQTVPVDVDIDGGLSLDEIEAFTDNSIDAKGSDLENLGSVSTEEINIGGVKWADKIGEVRDISSSSVTVDFDGDLGLGDFILLRGSIQLAQSGILKAQFDSNVGDYGYELSDGTRVNASDHWVINDGGGLPSAKGVVEIGREPDLSTSAVGWSSLSYGVDRWDRCDYITDGGTDNEPDAPSEIEFYRDDGDDVRVDITVYRGRYA